MSAEGALGHSSCPREPSFQRSGEQAPDSGPARSQAAVDPPPRSLHPRQRLLPTRLKNTPLSHGCSVGRTGAHQLPTHMVAVLDATGYGVGRAPHEGGCPGRRGTWGWARHPVKVAVLDATGHGGGQGTPCLRAAPQPHRGPCGAHSTLMPRLPLLSADRPLVRTSVCAAGEAPGRGEEGAA